MATATGQKICVAGDNRLGAPCNCCGQHPIVVVVTGLGGTLRLPEAQEPNLVA
jgi:hypothetical protein